MDIHTKFEIEGVGPHETKLALDDTLKSNAVAIFARNGSGKSFISKVFRLVARIAWKVAHGQSNGTEVLQKNEAYTLLSVGQRFGKMELSQQHGNECAKEFSINVSVQDDGNERAVLQGATDYIFRVFNSQYVDENIKKHEYVLPGQTSQGWVIGETNIQIDNLQSELRCLSDREMKLREKFANAGRELAVRLNSQYKVSKNTGVFKQLFAEDKFSITANVDVDGVREFAVVAEKLSTLASIPDDLSDINYLSECQPPMALLDEISRYLDTIVPKSTIVGAGADEIKRNRDFFEIGLRLSLSDTKHCPFCRQDMTETAIGMLEQYRTFLAGAEVKAAKKAIGFKEQIVSYREKMALMEKSLHTQHSQILSAGRYFDSLTQLLASITVFPNFDIGPIDRLIELLACKSQDPSVRMVLPDDLKDALIKGADEIERTRREFDRIARIVNAKKTSITQDRLTLRIELVKAAFIELKKSLQNDIADWTTIADEIKIKKATLDSLLEGNREPKRKLVFDSAAALLKELFGEKYSLRQEDFVLQFKGNADPNRPASVILSDGEKSALSFCYFLAETHLLIEKKSDYKKLFFIFDDPVSSMDAQFVYAISNLLKRIDWVFPGMVNVPKRYWIFTHSMDFYAILVRNNVCKEGLVLYDGVFRKIPESMLLPFESHLADVVRVADEIERPAHTTGNSIRHVLETLAKFEYPLKTIDQFVADESELAGNPNVLLFANDYSHGAFQNDQISIEPIIISVCKAVADYVKSRYPGQIAAIQENYVLAHSALVQ